MCAQIELTVKFRINHIFVRKLVNLSRRPYAIDSRLYQQSKQHPPWIRRIARLIQVLRLDLANIYATHHSHYQVADVVSWYEITNTQGKEP